MGYRQIAGNLSLDFVNTLGGNHDVEYLPDYASLVEWSRQAEHLTRPLATALLARAKRHPGLTDEVLRRMKSLREATYQVVTDKIHHRAPSADDLFLISREASFAVARAKITSTKSGLKWIWPDSDLDLARVLWPIARATADLLTSDAMEKVGACARENCTWVFLDTSKNHRRRWCVMEDCGNREKVRRFRSR